MKPHESHRKDAPQKQLLVQVVSFDPGADEGTKSGIHAAAVRKAEKAIAKAGHSLQSSAELVHDDKLLTKEISRFLDGRGDVIIVVGGTGLAKADVAIETARSFFEKELVGFGELVRRLNYEESGPAAIHLRATAGVVKGKLLVCLPDSPHTVERVLGEFAAEFPHVVFVARKAPVH